MQIRVIGSDDQAQAVLTELHHRARALLGPGYTYRTHTRSARRIGHIRVYLTITRKERSTDATSESIQPGGALHGG
jgi:hypothetical protein